MRKFKIGIPKAFLYYKYQVLWRRFFQELGHETIVSPDTNKAILDAGSNCSVDESCASAKVFMGHVEWLIGKCDYILIPRIASYENGDITCTKFFALYDIVKTTFPDAKLLHYNVDYKNKKTEWQAYHSLGKMVGAATRAIKAAYSKGRAALKEFESDLERKQSKILDNGNIKVLIVAHPYNIYDKLIGEPIINMLEALGVDVLYSDIPESEKAAKLSKKLSHSLYWQQNKEITGSIEFYKDRFDGIIFLTAFPCGPDAMVVELLTRKLKGIPILNLVSDANFGEAGLNTRIESFVDIIFDKNRTA